MEQILNEENLVGKTIKKAVDDIDRLFLIFEDSFCIIKAGYGYPEIEQNKFDTNPAIDNFKRLFFLGFIDKKESNKFEKEYEDTKKLHEENKRTKFVASELKLLAELKAKYEK